MPRNSSASTTVALAAGLLLSLSPAVAQAYTSASGPVEQLQILRTAIADGTAVALSGETAVAQPPTWASAPPP